jgi:ATP-dependent Zn protease
MTKDLMLTLLNRAATGNEMLAMIDGFSDNEPAEVETAQPTLEEIQF